MECVVIAKDLAYRGRVNAAIINNDALYAEKQGVFSVIREGDLDIYKILGTELEKWRKGISSGGTFTPPYRPAASADRQ